MMKKHTTTFQFRPNGIKSLLLMLLFLVMGVGESVGQSEIESGFYYIENKQDNNGYFLVPAAGTGSVKYFKGNEATPYLTTYQKSKATDTDNNFIWYIQKVSQGDKNYYRFIHCLTGKYITMNGVEDTGNPASRRFHLEAMEEPSPYAQFLIGYHSNGERIGIRHETLSATNTDGKVYWWWDISDGNKDNYSQNDYKGLLGLWQEQNAAEKDRCKWAMPAKVADDTNICLPPVITYDAETKKVTISTLAEDSGVEFYYTTDGTTEPTTSATRYTEPFTLPEDATIVKAIAKKGNFTNSTVRIYNTEQCAKPVITFNESDGTYTVTSTTEGVTFYYTTDETTPTITSESSTGTITLPLDFDGEFLKVVCVRTNGDGSDISDVATIEIPQCVKPSITNKNNGNFEIKNNDTNGAYVVYTTNGDPKSDGATRMSNTTETLTYTIEQSVPTIKARAYKAGYRRSDLVTLAATKVDKPSLINANDGSVTMATTTGGATIYYTTSNTSTGPANPTTSSTPYEAGAFRLGINTDITTIKVKAFKLGMTPSDVLTYTVPSCDAPYISHADGKITITPHLSDDQIYYSLSESGDDWTAYNGPITTGSENTVRAYASHVGYHNSDIVSYAKAKPISNVSEITDMGGNYELAPGFSWNAPIGTEDNPFTGTLDGQFNTFSRISQPLVGYAKNATIKNIFLDNVNISGTDVGAICCVADGTTKIYNCGVLQTNSGIITGSGAVGGIVGLIKQGSQVRVVNCYNYATIRGGTHAAGIVGRNDGTVDKKTVDNVRIAMNIMYGDIESGTVIAPVYVGSVTAKDGVLDNTHQTNVQQLNNYNYYRSRANLTYTPGYYNEQLAIDKDIFIYRFPFYRHILNTHRELAAYYLFGDYATSHVGEIGHWVLKSDVSPFPIIERWETNTHKVRDAEVPAVTEDYAGKMLTEMGNSGRLGLTVKINDQTYSASLPITDMDTLRYDYTWGKVVLPFANEFGNKEGETAWTRDYTKVCTGWKITSVTKDGTSLTIFNIPTAEPYNFADRDNPQKDIYDATNNPYIFAQGGNYIVPYGVTEITIEANFANAFYLSDEYYDYGYNNNYGGATGLGGKVPTTYHGQTVYTNLSTLVGKLTNSTNPHSQAIVLVGNYHYNQNTVGQTPLNTGKACSIMSIDSDCNQEPDFGWYSYHTKDRTVIPPLRFDFVPNIGIGMAARVTGSKPNPTIGIWHSKGWFELTETSLSLMSECEIASSNFTNGDDGSGNNRWIANSGYFIQIVRCRKGNCSKLSYIQIGGNAFVEELYPGSHSDDANTTTLVPINVTGGEIKECYMTGYKAGASATGSNIRFWCAGGKIHKWLGAYLENPSTAGVNVTAKIDHARIKRFFGGGTSPSARITGNIDITMNNSLVDFYCGGPEFGDMATGKAVTTHATNTTFGEYYGAGFGGTSITYNREGNNTSVDFGSDKEFPIAFSDTYKRLTYKANYGIGVNYKFEYILYAGGSGTGVARSYTGYAAFSLATTGNVSNVLNGCTIKGDFYGAGCQGKVNGSVTSTLTGCKVNGSAFGGGFKATSNEVNVYRVTEPTKSKYIKETGLFSDFGTVSPEVYTWVQGTSGNENKADGTTLLTSKDINMSELGNVSGAITLTIDGGSVAGNVFGGGNESKSLNNTQVNIINGDITGDVYGGGNVADVNGDTRLHLLGGTITGNVYGGGKGQLATAAVGTAGQEGYVPAKEDVEAKVGSTQVNLNGMSAAEYKADYDTWGLVKGGEEDDAPYIVANTGVKGCVVKGSIFGCNNINGTPQGDATVHVYKTQNANATQIGNINEVTNAKVKNRYDLTAVYGGGNLAAFIPAAANESTASTHVIIDGCDLTSIETVYGGGNAASTPATDVTVNGTYEIKELFGGGNGLTALPDGRPNPGANVGYKNYTEYVDEGGTLVARDKEEANTKEKRLTSGYVYGSGAANVTIYGGTIHQVFGGSNTKGNVRISAVTLLEDQDVCEFCVDEAYGGGKSAPMDAEAKLLMSCIPGLKAAYGGAEAANIEGDVTLNITNGNFDRVFGGNNKSGRIGGTITVNIEETGCKPVIIGQLYGGGNQAPYTAPEGEDGPTLNIKSFTSIGEVYGGGYGEGAVVTGDTYVNINEVVGDKSSQDEFMKETVADVTDPATQTTGTDKVSKNTGVTKTFKDGDGDDANTISVDIPLHKKGDIGSIGVVFGGGNAAQVVGNTHVNIGTLSSVDYVTKASGESDARKGITPVGADIRGNVYGGGNNAVVTGNTNVVIGKKYEATP